MTTRTICNDSSAMIWGETLSVTEKMLTFVTKEITATLMKDCFTFKQFVVRHDMCAMKVGTDGVLLGSWGDGGDRILDIGTGTGLIALMMAQRFDSAHIDCIDIDPKACQQARGNVADSRFASRINVYHSDVSAFEPPQRYDSIVCNPPFFSESLKCPDEQRSMARHTDSLLPRDLFRHAYRLLTPDGLLSIIIPTDQSAVFLRESSIAGFFIHKKTLIKTTEKKTAKRMLVTFGKHQTDSYQEECHVLMEGGDRSAWYKTLTEDFYL